MDKEPLDYWNHQARNYDDNIFSTIDEDSTGIISKTIERFGCQEDGIWGRCIDLGCGAGKYLAKLGHHFRHVIAYDLSPKLIALSQKELNKRSVKNVEVAVRDLSQVWYREMGSGSNNFGQASEMESYGFAVMANVLIAPVTDGLRSVMLRNAHRSLCAGGRVLVIVPSFESALYVNQRCDEVSYDGPYVTGAGGNKPSRNEGGDLLKGIMKRSGVRTKHFLEPEFCLLAKRIGFDVEVCEKVSYSWRSELGLTSDLQVPSGLRDPPLPWDWLFLLQKVVEKKDTCGEGVLKSKSATGGDVFRRSANPYDQGGHDPPPQVPGLPSLAQHSRDAQRPPLLPNSPEMPRSARKWEADEFDKTQEQALPVRHAPQSARVGRSSELRAESIS